MKTSFSRCFRRTEQGSVAIEAAIILPILILFLAVPIFLARIFWYYSVVEKAAHDSARFLSQASKVEIFGPGNGGKPGVVGLVEGIIDAELEEIKPGVEMLPPTILCGGYTCGGESAPADVRVAVRILVRDEMFAPVTNSIFGEDGLRLTADVTMRYAGN
ncbi:hypothetical protein MasN3_30450 [Massilia varians]|uniref:TadE-like domain-containing protein n=1 Tax=Massilia varians TaxID=457921 RepID=A0ABM8C8F2_9BURK|nr:TadE/TadG family type IV pilus assembly protein [Massilia varians]BDT59551.1 hypothetical protein MasN3_30450 [Massilia varians]